MTSAKCQKIKGQHKTQEESLLLFLVFLLLPSPLQLRIKHPSTAPPLHPGATHDARPALEVSYLHLFNQVNSPPPSRPGSCQDTPPCNGRSVSCISPPSSALKVIGPSLPSPPGFSPGARRAWEVRYLHFPSLPCMGGQILAPTLPHLHGRSDTCTSPPSPAW